MGGLELAVLAPDRGVALAIGDHVGVGHLPLELGEPSLDLLYELLDHAVECAKQPKGPRQGGARGSDQDAGGDAAFGLEPTRTPSWCSSADFAWRRLKRSTRPPVSTSFCLPV